jgi:hypothetical protein
MTAGLQVPVMPLVELVESVGATEFWHNGPICVNTGLTCGSITMVIVAVAAHWPALGVKVYTVDPAVVVLMVAGLHVPVTVLFEMAGSKGAAEFWQSGPICVNAGITLVETTISIVAGAAHWPASGVKVYVTIPATAVLIVAGLQVPVIAGRFVELNGNDGAVEFRHNGPICVRVGVILVDTTISIVVGAAHWPAIGVKV